jgi:uncharacterized protein (DUF2267 family)
MLQCIAGIFRRRSPATSEDAMSDTQVTALDHTVQQTNIWLKKLESDHHLPGRHHAYAALRAVLHALRDRMTPEQAAHLGAQLPTLVRGIFYEGWHPAGTPKTDRQVQAFLAHVAAELPPQYPRDALGVTEAVFEVLAHELDPGEIAKVVGALPAPLRALWPVAARS